MHLNLIIITWFSELIFGDVNFILNKIIATLREWETLKEKSECVEATFWMLNDW